MAATLKDSEFKDCGKHLFSARTRLGLTQNQLAALSRIDSSIINRIERFHRWPTLAQLARLAAALQVSLQWFMNGANTPGTDLQDIGIELGDLGIVDLWVANSRVPGAFRPREELVALALSDKEPEPRIVEAIPAALAWNQWNVRLLRAYGHEHGERTIYRLAWLADVAVTIDKHFGFPLGCPGRQQLSRFLDRVKKPTDRDGQKPSKSLDGLGRPTTEAQLHPVWRRWRISYAADLDTFKSRAEHLKTLLEKSRPRRFPPQRDK